jgi:DNA mismatch repair protein MutS
MTTPMMQQYREAKLRHPGMLLFFRNGDFYELFEEDAELGSRLLGITLTKRDKEIPMAGVPHHALDRYLARLLQAGHRVAICDQVEDAAQAKGLIRREVTRVVTPGTLTEDNLLDPRRSNHLVAVRAAGEQVGLAWVELSTGQFQAADVPWSRLADELGRLAPAECLMSEDGPAQLGERLREAAPATALTARPGWTFDPNTAHAALFSHFGVNTLNGFGFDDGQPCLVAAGALLLYVQETLKASLGHLSRLRPYRQDRFLFLDEVTRRSLELTRTLRDGERAGSLLSVLDRTVTPMGARLLQEWVVAPLAERLAIEARLDAVEELRAEEGQRAELRATLGEAYDLQRLTARVSTGRASPRDLAGVRDTLRLLPRVKAKVAARKSKLLNDLEGRLELCPDLRELLDGALVEQPPVYPREGGLVRSGYDPELDELHAITRDGKDWMTRFQADEIIRTGIPSLKVGFNQVFGYYIEISHAQAQRTPVPADFIRKQTVKNAERYITPELKEYEAKVREADDRAHALEYELFVTLRDRVAAEAPRLIQAGGVLAQIDALSALAELAARQGYCRPEMVAEPVLEIESGRHPVLDALMHTGDFVPNDTQLGAGAGTERGTILLITGPNMAGKSTYIRQVALIAVLAQIGSFVPARRARIGIVDRLFARVGATDELSRGQSTFMVEMTETANILNNATARSLVILDEIGRGTSTFDGISLAWAVTEHLHDQLGCRTLFATHYHELVELEKTKARLKNANVAVRESGGEIVFLHQIVAGGADQSYGIHVARLAGVPAAVLERARAILAFLEKQHGPDPGPPSGPIRKVKTGRALQGSLFAALPDPLLAELRKTDPANLSADEAQALIRRLKELAD